MIHSNFPGCLHDNQLPKFGYLKEDDQWVHLFYGSIVIMLICVITCASLPMLRQHGYCLCLACACCRDQYHNIQSQPDTL
jgi:hypothetical protein